MNISQPDPLVIGAGFIIQLGQGNLPIDTLVIGPTSPLFFADAGI